MNMRALVAALALLSRSSLAMVAPAAYRLGELDLSSRWEGLVKEGAVEACAGDAVYGVKASGDGFEFFVEGPSEEAQALGAALAASGGGGVEARSDGDFVAQLQLVRTLRPAPAFETGGDGPTSCAPPPYAPGSLVTGPLRLELRPLVGRVTFAEASPPRAWDVRHNVAPCDARGHFLLLPRTDLEANWRAQARPQRRTTGVVRLLRIAPGLRRRPTNPRSRRPL